MQAKAKAFYSLALSGFLGLFILLLVWHTLWHPPARLPVALVLLFTITPLLLPMRGLLKANARSCAWMAFLSIAYFVHGTVEAYANSAERLPAALEIVFSSVLFAGSTLFIRFKNR